MIFHMDLNPLKLEHGVAESSSEQRTKTTWQHGYLAPFWRHDWNAYEVKSDEKFVIVHLQRHFDNDDGNGDDQFILIFLFTELT